MAEEKMIDRVVNARITVVREGKRVTPPIGSTFGFTKDELKQLDGELPSSTRAPINESAAPAADVNVGDDSASSPAAKKATKTAAAAKAKADASTPEKPVGATGPESGEKADDADKDEDEDI